MFAIVSVDLYIHQLALVPKQVGLCSSDWALSYHEIMLIHGHTRQLHCTALCGAK